jgi:2-dehydro-3-deoxygluconokinase
MKKMKALFIGECMVELSDAGDGLLKKSFAGDVFNSAVYMKRRIKDNCEVSVLTAIGEDSISREMEAFFELQGLGTETVHKSSEGTVGLYLISTDSEGERSFSYWREKSMARLLMNLLDDRATTISEYSADLYFFTGITLAILDADDREKLLAQLSEARKNGSKVAFDPNYRSQLWENKAVAAEWIDRAYKISDIIFPGVDEEYELFGTKSVDNCISRLEKYAETEVVLKAGDEGIYVISGGNQTHLEFTPADKVVDTTAAGDAFDGTYLAMRLSGNNTGDSLAKAASVAAKVVTYPGAIVPEALTR